MILRNSPSSVSGLRYLLFLAIRSRPGFHRTTTALLCVAAANFTFFLAAGILSSRVTATRPDVLLRPTNCGRWWAFNNASRQDTGTGVYGANILYTHATSALASLRYASSDYAISCYESETPSEECTSFDRQLPTWTTDLRKGCVFGDSLCDDNTTFHIDSGHMDSTVLFGINTPRTDRLSLRLTMDCAPLATSDGHFDTYDGTDLPSLLEDDIAPYKKEILTDVLSPGWEDYEYEVFFYGRTPLWTSHNATYLWSNSTLTSSLIGVRGMVSLFPFYYYRCLDIASGTNETADSLACSDDFSTWTPWTIWHPIVDLKVPHHNTVLLFLTWGPWSFQPINDPWFRTNVKITLAGLKPIYRPKHYTKPLACATRTEICKLRANTASHCVQLNPYGWPLPFTDGLPGNITTMLGLNTKQTAVAHRLQEASWVGDFYSAVNVLGVQRMLAWQEHFGGEYVVGLPDDQWTREIEHWFATLLITMQSYTTQYATGWQDRGINRFVTPPPEADMWMCESQIIQRRDYASFSVLGIAIILTIGGLVVLLNTVITWVVNRVRSRTPTHMYKTGSWMANDLLQLHDAAAEGVHQRAMSYDLETTVVQETTDESVKPQPSMAEPVLFPEEKSYV